MSGFPVNLDLSEYFADLRKYSSVFVNLSKCKDVGDVENHIKSVFKLEDNICLIHKKFLIPKSEDIQILQQYEIFKVQKCNFYDHQIHKTKKVNAVTCDQKALNLTQSEKTIDLSCRPKQRLRANTSPSPGISGTLTFHVDNSKHVDSQVPSPTRTTLINGIQNNSKEKQKHKKKRHLQIDESDDETGTDGNILDMSVKNSRRKKHSNCFSTDDGSLKSESAIGNNCTGISRDLQKKFKKRKKHLENLDDYSVDLASTNWNSLVYDNNGIKDQNSKKKSKRAREDCFNGGSSIDTNNTAVKNELENQVELDTTHSVDNECSNRKKHKQRKYTESKLLGECQESQYYSSTPTCTSKSHNPKKSNILKKYYDKLEEDSDLSKHLEQEKKRLKLEIDQIISQTHKNNLDTNSQNSGDENESIISSVKTSKSERNIEKEGGLPEKDTKQECCSEFDFTNRKVKRKRKHNKKKKEKVANLMYMYAVGPALNQLATEPTIPRPSTSVVGVKHVFFPEDDSTEDTGIPLTPPVKSQTIPDSSEPPNNHAEVNPTQEQSSPKPVPWQEQLIKLASTNSKPVVFHRHPTGATTNKQVSSSQLNQEHSSGEKPTLSPVQTDHNSSDIQDREINCMADDFKRCNGDVKTDSNNEANGSCSGTVNSSNSRKALPDICKPLPIPNDLHNINLTDYPIIDKVVAEDLILFKVLKLSENSEPGVSKPILARVNGTSNFPDRISLQIMEGCEECSHCIQTEESGDAFIIELRWTDIMEPRLFYP